MHGYRRIDGQSVDAQIAALTAAGAEKVFHEVASGAKTDRAQLRRLLDQLDAGDVLTVTRLARSTRDLLTFSTPSRRSPASKLASVRSATHAPTPPRRTAA